MSRTVRKVRMVGSMVMVGLCGLGAGGHDAFAAQDASQETGQSQLQHLDRALHLTEAERSQIQQVTQDYQTRRQQLLDQLTTLRQEENSKIKAVLTSEQQAQFDQMQQDRKERRQDQGPRDQQDGRVPGHRHSWHGGSDRWGS